MLTDILLNSFVMEPYTKIFIRKKMIHCLGLVFKYLAKIKITIPTKGTQGNKELMVNIDIY